MGRADLNPDQEPTPQLHIPDHRLLSLIGRGSYGEVWLGRSVTGAYRAIKIVWKQNFSDPRPFERELAGITNFDPVSRSHKGFVDVLHVGRSEDGDCLYYIMEVADDCETGQAIDPARYKPKTLGTVLERTPRFPFEECLQLGLSLSNALSHLHNRGLAHRDIKPSNIIFVNGFPKLADIGLVASIDDPLSYVGTEGFFPPEGPGSPQADIFSLGKVLYEISLGQDRKAYPRLPGEFASWPDKDRLLELNEILFRACDDDARKRYQTAEELNADLTFLLNGRSVKRLRLLERRMGTFIKGSVVGGTALLLFFLGYYLFEHERKLQAEHRSRQIGGYMVTGIRSMEDGDLLGALPSFVDALRLDAKGRESAHRTRLALALSQSPKLLQMWAFAGEISDTRCSSDGQHAVVCTRTNKAQVVDLQNGQPLSPFFGPRTGELESGCFSPDGRLVLLASTQRTASLWDWRAGRQVAHSIVHPRTVTDANFNPQGDRIVTACMDYIARIWDLKGKLLLTFTNHTGTLRSAKYSPNGKWVITTGEDNSARIWEAATGREIVRPLLHRSWVLQAGFSPDMKRVITACSDRSAHVWELAEGREIFPPLTHPDGLSSAEFSADGRLILTGCWDGTARIWDAATGHAARLNPILPHSSRVLRACFHPDGHRVLTASLDGTSRLWELAGAAISAPKLHAPFSLDGSRYLLHSNEWLQVTDSLTKQVQARLQIPPGLRDVALSDDGRFVLLQCDSVSGELVTNSELLIFDGFGGTNYCRVPDFTNSLHNSVLSRQGRWLACHLRKLVRLYDLRRANPVPLAIPQPDVVAKIYFIPNESDLLILSGTQALLWDLDSRKPRLNLPHPAAVGSASISPDEKLLATCCADEWFTACSAYIWDLASGKACGRPLPHHDGVARVCFAPDQKHVLTSGEDFLALLWELNSSQKPKKLPHRHQVHDGCFDPSGSRILTVSRDQTARLWDAESGEPLGPPFPHPSSLSHGAFLGSDSFLTFNSQGDSWSWQITSDGSAIEDLARLAQVLNGRVETETGELSPQALVAAWRGLREKYPQHFTISRERILAWHQQQGELALAEDQLRAASFHFDRFLELEPHNEAVLQQRTTALTRLASEKAPSDK